MALDLCHQLSYVFHEIRSHITLLDLSLSDILREVNELADGLAKRGLSCL